MPILDLISAAYVGVGALRGRKRGLADEAYRLIRLAVAFVAGAGLYGIVSDLISRALSLGGEVSGPVGFVATMGGAWYALRVLRKSITDWLAGRYASIAGIGGAIAGGLRSAIMVLSVVGVMGMAADDGKGFVDERESIVATVARWILPGR